MLLRKDSDLKHDVRNELRWDTRIQETAVGVHVAEGIVTLHGSVGGYAAGIAAQEAAQRVTGVREVRNELLVIPDPAARRDDREIEQTIRRLLEWDVRVPHEGITVSVVNGCVTLAGRVGSMTQRADAEHAIRYVAGVLRVANEIEVTPQKVSPQEIGAVIRQALARSAVSFPERIEVIVADGAVTLAGQISSWRDKLAVLGAVGHAPGVRAIYDQMRVDPYS